MIKLKCENLSYTDVISKPHQGDVMDFRPEFLDCRKVRGGIYATRYNIQ